MLSFDSCIIDLDHGHQERQNAILFPSLILSRVYIHGVSLFYHNSNIKTDFQKEAEWTSLVWRLFDGANSVHCFVRFILSHPPTIRYRQGNLSALVLYYWRSITLQKRSGWEHTVPNFQTIASRLPSSSWLESSVARHDLIWWNQVWISIFTIPCKTQRSRVQALDKVVRGWGYTW